MAEQRITYSEYLHLHQMLALQDGGTASGREITHDEMHFIIVHQSFELWFKLIINELTTAKSILSKEQVPESDIPIVVQHFRRTIEILKLMQSQWRVMETLSPQGFLAFRDDLGTASGFESFQMRHLEIILGLDKKNRPGGMDPLAHFKKLASESEDGEKAWQRLLKVSSEDTLVDVLTNWLARTPINGSVPSDEGDETVVSTFIGSHLESMAKHDADSLARHISLGTTNIEKVEEGFSKSQQAAADFLIPEGNISRHRAGLLFIESYRELPLLSWPRALIDCIVELEQQLLLFRHHHARMVERMIGRRVGTGGTSGVDYLDMTTKPRIFTDLWEVRTLLVKRSEISDVENPEFYGFA